MDKNDRELDCFFTNADTVNQCLGTLKEFIDFNNIDLFIEPSAGAGAFLKKLPKQRLGIDIRPENNEIIKGDFLQWYPNKDMQNIAVVGNPPFGKNSNLAVSFFNHSCSFSNYVAMVLPKTFKKTSIINRLNNKFHLVNEIILPNNSFKFMGNPYSVPCVFQIWEKRCYNRPFIKEKLSHPDFEFSDKLQCDFAIQRVGANAGRIKENYENYSCSSHYFIKKIENYVLNVFYSINWDNIKYNTAGNPSISKGEVVKLYEKERTNYV